MIKIKTSLTCLLMSLLFTSCMLNCNKNFIGKYYKQKEGVINYLEIKRNGDFLHYYSEGETVLTHEGKWEKNKEGHFRL